MDPSQGYPYCRVYLAGVVNEMYDNAPSDWRTYRFAVDIFQEYAAKSPAQAEVDFDKAVDAAMDKLAAQWRLPDGSSVPTVDVSQVTTGQIAAIEPPFGPAIYLQLIVECKTLVS
jgi:hypothetical protein